MLNCNNMLEKIRNITSGKFVKIAALLALMNAGRNVQAENIKDSFNEKTTTNKVSTEKKSELEASDDAYVFSEADIAKMANKEKFEVAKIDFNVNYETDKADLNEGYKQAIFNQFVNFLDNINQDNFDIASKSDWQVYSSCDERKTNAWGSEGNKALAQARGSSIITELNQVLSTYEFNNLKPEEAVILKNKEIINKIAAEHSDRQGETLITDKLNPETGKNYTDEEVKNLKDKNPDKYFSLLSENRISEFRAEIPVADLNLKRFNMPPIENRPPKLSVIDKPEMVNRFINYQNIILLLDNSGSMGDNKKELGEEIDAQKDNLKNSNIFIGHYSDKLHEMNQVEDINKTKAEIMKTIGGGSSRELSVHVAVEAWDKVGANIKSNEKTLLLVITDESLQQISASDLDKLANLPGNVEVKFAFHLGAGQDLEVSLKSIQSEFDVQQGEISRKLELQIENMNTKVKGMDDALIKLHSRLFQSKNNSFKRQTEKQIDIAEKRQKFYLSSVEALYKKMEEKKKITLNKVTGDDGKSVALNNYF